MNPVAQALTGWSQDEAAGRRMEEVFAIINEQTRQPAENPVATVIREGRIVGLANHTVLVARDGTEGPSTIAPLRSRTKRARSAASCWYSATSPDASSSKT